MIWMFLSVIPAITNMLGANFVPSMEWVSTAYFPGIVAGVVMGLFVTWAYGKHMLAMPEVSTKHFFVLLFAPIFGFMFGRRIVMVVPMIVALFAGHQVEHAFAVTRADGSSKGCHSSVELDRLPFPFDRICGVSNDFKTLLKPGSRIVASGRGTSLGLYVSEVRTAD